MGNRLAQMWGRGSPHLAFAWRTSSVLLGRVSACRLYRLVRRGCRGLYRFIVRHYLQRRDDEVASSARNVVPGVGIPFVGLGFILAEGLVAIAVFTEDYV